MSDSLPSGLGTNILLFSWSSLNSHWWSLFNYCVVVVLSSFSVCLVVGSPSFGPTVALKSGIFCLRLWDFQFKVIKILFFIFFLFQLFSCSLSQDEGGLQQSRRERCKQLKKQPVKLDQISTQRRF